MGSFTPPPFSSFVGLWPSPRIQKDWHIGLLSSDIRILPTKRLEIFFLDVDKRIVCMVLVFIANLRQRIIILYTQSTKSNNNLDYILLNKMRKQICTNNPKLNYINFINYFSNKYTKEQVQNAIYPNNKKNFMNRFNWKVFTRKHQYIHIYFKTFFHSMCNMPVYCKSLLRKVFMVFYHNCLITYYKCLSFSFLFESSNISIIYMLCIQED